MCLRAAQGGFGFTGQGGTQEVVSLEGSQGSVEARSEAAFGSLGFTRPLLSPAMDVD